MLGARELKGLAQRSVGSGFANAATDGVSHCEQLKAVAKLQVCATKVNRSAFAARHRQHDSPPGLKFHGEEAQSVLPSIN